MRHNDFNSQSKPVTAFSLKAETHFAQLDLKKNVHVHIYNFISFANPSLKTFI